MPEHPTRSACCTVCPPARTDKRHIAEANADELLQIRIALMSARPAGA
jgi:hypothetical protein